ncbi:hypothetical protein AMS68_003908 [Peltaster fructicola]|uniref:HIG1 domain-containing protein n=1 Tax=Peltaster fructicola TaxID=286661 RepID=A0A6H0XUP1_9PEZI|nr:hypothetical protein AMS68_003908 [Peltaster fructicola]
MSRSQHSAFANDAELESASWAAARGAAWAIFGALAAGVGMMYSPVYRGLTVQFKVFLQMSFMTFGGVIEADKYLRQHGRIMRSRKQMIRDAEVWRRYEAEYGSKE